MVRSSSFFCSLIPFFLGALFYLTPGYGADQVIKNTQAPIQAPKAPIRVGVINVPPFSFKENGDLSGIHVDFIKQVLEDAKIPYIIKVLPYRRVVKNVQSGALDLAFFFKQKEMKNTQVIAKSLGFKNFVVSKDSQQLKTFQDLKGKRIGVVRSAKYEERFDNSKDIKRIAIEKYSQGLRMLKLNRLEGVVISEPALNFLKKEDEKSAKDLRPTMTLNTQYNYFYGNKSLGQDIIKKIKASNDKMLKSDAIEPILKKYLSQEEQKIRSKRRLALKRPPFQERRVISSK